MTSRCAAFALPFLLVPLMPVAAQPAQEPGFLPLEKVEGTRVRHRTPRQVLFNLLRGLGRRGPLQKLIPPTTGKLRLAVVLVEFKDTKRPKWGAPQTWEDSLFSKGTFAKTVTGQPAFGSMRDYYLENSGGTFDVTGKVFDWVKVDLARKDLEGQTAISPRLRRNLLGSALDQLLKREGAKALDEFHALAFVVAGKQARRRGNLLWPHSAILMHGRKVWRYYLMHSGRKWFQPIGVHCHELGHVLGLYDKYGIGSGTGLGQWCLMASGAHGARSKGIALGAPTTDAFDRGLAYLELQLRQLRQRLRARRKRPVEKKKTKKPGTKPKPKPKPKPPLSSALPLHYCAVCKDRLGWSKPKVVDPRKPTRLFLTPIETDASQIARVLLDPRGRETLYLEYRAARGFDRRLPQGGLFVWRAGSPTAFLRTFVAIERVELIPAHGVDSMDAPKRAPKSVPFPIEGKTSLVARGTLPGSWRVQISEIERKDGKLYLRINLADAR